MTSRAAWSRDKADILAGTHLPGGTVLVHHHHVDEFDADDDYSVLVGEFTVADLQRALIPPLPAAVHAANKRPNPLAWLRRRNVA